MICFEPEIYPQCKEMSSIREQRHLHIFAGFDSTACDVFYFVELHVLTEGLYYQLYMTYSEGKLLLFA